MSGVYVKGLGMPKNGEHPYWVTIHSDGTVEYNENKGQGWQTSEAVPVPDHGRLGDLDELEKSFQEDADDPWNKRAIPMNWADAFGEVADIISASPTILPADKEGEA